MEMVAQYTSAIGMKFGLDEYAVNIHGVKGLYDGGDVHMIGGRITKHLI